MKRRIPAFLVALVVTAGCGVQADSSPRDLPETEQALESPDIASGDVASGADRIYLIAPGTPGEERLLRSVQREAVGASDLMETLLRGPNDDEIELQYNTAIPTTTELNDARSSGQTLVVDLTPDIIDLDTQSLIRAIAQIVYTATELPGIVNVQILIDGERLSAPTPAGDTTTLPLSVYDFPSAVLTSQPAFPAGPVAATA